MQLWFFVQRPCELAHLHAIPIWQPASSGFSCESHGKWISRCQCFSALVDWHVQCSRSPPSGLCSSSWPASHFSLAMVLTPRGWGRPWRALAGVQWSCERVATRRGRRPSSNHPHRHHRRAFHWAHQGSRRLPSVQHRTDVHGVGAGRVCRAACLDQTMPPRDRFVPSPSPLLESPWSPLFEGRARRPACFLFVPAFLRACELAWALPLRQPRPS